MGEKMSKSLGNVNNLLDFVEVYDPRAYRMVLLQSHYRSPITVNADTIDAATNALAGLDSFVARTAGVSDAAPDPAVLDAFRLAMDDDLDTPKATALLFDTVRQANSALDAGDASAPALVAAAKEIAATFGLELGKVDDVPTEIAAKAAALDQASAGQGLRIRRRDSCRADGRRLERRNHQRRHQRPPLSHPWGVPSRRG